MVDINAKNPRLPIGIDDYKDLIDEDCIYIDKTLLIKEFLGSANKVTLVTRPRRFGKSIALSMLKYFFEKTEESTSYLFEKSKIWQEEGFKQLQGTFPVIHISLKDIRGTTWAEACEEFKILLAKEVSRALAPLASQMNDTQKKTYESLINKKASEVEFTESLIFISEINKKHLDKTTIILIDEYDSPITHAYVHKFYDKMIEFMRQLLSKALKSNTNLHRGFMTGVVRTAKDGIVSGLNNPKICTMLDANFSDKFGFTQEEVDHLLQITNRKDKGAEVKKWYNGYVIGTKNSKLARSVYNPWSVLNYLGSFSEHPECYWSNTGSTNLLERLIAEADVKTQEELRLLIEGKALENKVIDEDVLLLDLDNKGCEPWSFLFFTGYLTATSYTFENKYAFQLKLPNKEISDLFKNLVMKAIDKKLSSAKLEDFLKALIKGDTPKVESSLREFVLSFCSSHDLPYYDLERSLHLFVLGLLVTLSERYIVDSNIESGKGRYDIMLCPKPHSQDLSVILEFKKGENLEKLASEALEQIKTKHYKTRLEKLGYLGPILAYGIATYKKELLVKLEIIT